MIWLQYIIPQHFLSKLIFGLTRIKSKWLKNILINCFIRYYKVDMSIALKEYTNDYQHFNDFFTRSLKNNVRTIAKCALTSPVDGSIYQLGEINNLQLLTAKGHNYNLTKLLANSNMATNFKHGFFTTIYLSPKSYHRIHMPYDGILKQMDYIPGSLFAVNAKTETSINGLFTKNERVICYFKTEFGLCALILIGAIFVGSIQTVWHGVVNPTYKKLAQNYIYAKQNINLKKGAELGRFNMGSTVIILVPKKIQTSLKCGSQVLMGQSLLL